MSISHYKYVVSFVLFLIFTYENTDQIKIITTLIINFILERASIYFNHIKNVCFYNTKSEAKLFQHEI